MSRSSPRTQPTSALIGDELKQFLHSGVAVVVGTHDSEMTPEICRAWGPQVAADGATLEMFLDRDPAAQTLANLRDNGLMAVTFVSPLDYRSVQLKGRCLRLDGDEPNAAESARIDRHRQAFADGCEMQGVSRQVVRNFWTVEVTRISFVATDAFDQTPGPAAGRSL
jgi:predicted pyridoxine 5'-phosphate oxidase superfamily flavin-nucleotide-binding protein